MAPTTSTVADERVDVLGVHLTPGSITKAVERIGAWIAADAREYVCVADVHVVINGKGDDDFRRILNESGMTTTDGMPLVWCARRAGFDDAERVYGPDLILAVSEKAAEMGWTSYFYGAAEGVPQKLAAVMETRYPGFQTAGAMSPPFRALSEEEDDAIVAEINASGANIVWVGLGAPKQERWMAEHRDRLDAQVLLGVGAAFDFHTGSTRQAPKWMQRNGLEWLFRLSTEPRRLWRRYFHSIPTFLFGIARRRPRKVS